MELFCDVERLAETMNNEKSGYLHYYRNLNIFSPQRQACHKYVDLLGYFAGQLEPEKMKAIFIHLEEHNCQACWNRLAGVTNRLEALAAIRRLNEGKRINKEERTRKKEKASEASPINLPESVKSELSSFTLLVNTKLWDLRYLNGENGEKVTKLGPEPDAAVGQVWLSRLNENRRPGKIGLVSHPPMWPLIITGINSDNQTFRVLPISPDTAMYDGNRTCRIKGDDSDYWNTGLVELFNEFTTPQSSLALYKGELNPELMRTLEESLANFSRDLPMLEAFSEWSNLEIELTAHLHCGDAVNI